MENLPALVDKHGAPLRKEVLTKEISGATIGGVRSVQTGYPGDGLNPERLAMILREADQGNPLRYFELAETIEERDAHYAGVLGTRKRSVAQLDIVIEPASEDAKDVEIADQVRNWVKRDELSDEIFDMLDAIGKGVSMTEIIWDTSEGQWMPKELAWRDPRWFRFDRLDGTTPMLRANEGDEPLPPFKFIHTVIRAKSGLPVRSGIARVACWVWMFKAYTMRDWSIFVQTFGQHLRVGKYGPNASEDEKDTLYRAVVNIAGDCAALIPASMEIEFVEAPSTTGHSQLFLDRSDWLDQQISKLVLGQVGTTDAIAGGFAVGKVHNNVRADIERADAKTIAGTLNRDLIIPWVTLDHGPQKAYPKLRIGRKDERDIKAVVSGVSTLVPLGLRVAMTDMNELLGVPVPDKDAEILKPTAAPAPKPQPDEDEIEEDEEPSEKELQSRQQQQRNDGIDELAQVTDDLTAAASDEVINRVRNLVDTSSSLEDIRDGLLALFPDLNGRAFADQMRLALTYTELSGRDEADSENA